MATRPNKEDNYVGLLGIFMANILKVWEQGDYIEFWSVFTNIGSKTETYTTFLCCYVYCSTGSYNKTNQMH